MTAYTTAQLVEIRPQIGLQNNQGDASVVLPFLVGVIVGIAAKSWFL